MSLGLGKIQQSIMSKLPAVVAPLTYGGEACQGCRCSKLIAAMWPGGKPTRSQLASLRRALHGLADSQHIRLVKAKGLLWIML